MLLENTLPGRHASLKCLLLLARDSRWCRNPRSDVQLVFESISWYLSAPIVVRAVGTEMDARMLSRSESYGVTRDTKSCSLSWEVKKS